ncbi:Zn-dependent hydrolase including glyoxylase-like protein [Caldicellulosiruptor hydrothermalis 108]|uniref:Zn-dependent hydrolase including glyoxylase-like protein n=1 Tax=Caldicellulosiruptor hydrothermalis (strain DSM 18901 / VKM B-2411 / 108) TaxID=632292 RepID=E4Q8R9_CALH1|nr:MBL fold metallo-hydrolase [Caldicellulosiruptor hydrothermalis]ADQ08043.1 Zn-dependent hydrolase including glyoxylase-like protein [Caldicellulosiruptor hydrothermalis 108]
MDETMFMQYNSWMVCEGTYFITTLNGSLYLYLLEGNKKALLIDTGYGFTNIREYVEGLTQKPIIVVNTHGHTDHSGGNGWWEEVYMHKNAPSDMFELKNVPVEHILPYPNYKKIFIEEGFEFDLGDRVVKVIDISAHSAGSLAFIDSKARMIFTGDELESQQVLMFDAVNAKPYDLKAKIEKHLENMHKIKKYDKNFDFICPAHNGAPISKLYIDDFVELDKKILEDKHTVGQLNHFYLSKEPYANKLVRVTYNRASFIYMIE